MMLESDRERWWNREPGHTHTHTHTHTRTHARTRARALSGDCRPALLRAAAGSCRS